MRGWDGGGGVLIREYVEGEAVGEEGEVLGVGLLGEVGVGVDCELGIAGLDGGVLR